MTKTNMKDTKTEEKKAPMPPKSSPELYEKATTLAKLAWKHPKDNKEKFQKRMGFLLQSVFQTKNVWTLKDLDTEQIEKLIEMAEPKAIHNEMRKNLIKPSQEPR